MRLFNLFILLIFSLNIIGCNQNDKLRSEQETKYEQASNNIAQTKDDLLAGFHGAVCYSRYRSGQHPDRGNGAINPSYEETLDDLRIIFESCNYQLIRVYDCGENSEMVLRVINDNNLKIKVLLGIWLRAELSNHETCAWLTEPIPDEVLQKNKKLNLVEIERGIKLANEYQNVVIAVNVGNEALVDWNDHKVSVDTIISYVKKVKRSIEQQVTVADNYKWWADHGSALAKEVDFVSIHIYPVWERKDINEGLSYSIENIKEVWKALPAARIVITEAGWASVASEFGSRASQEKQHQYYSELMSWTKERNITTFWFEAFDEDWKGNPNDMLGAEKHWGLFTVNRKPKKVVSILNHQ